MTPNGANANLKHLSKPCLSVSVSQLQAFVQAKKHTSSKIRSTTWRRFLDLFEIFPVLLDSFQRCLGDFTLTKRVRVPGLEAFFLRGCRIAHAFRAMGLENHGLERMGCSRHDDGETVRKQDRLHKSRRCPGIVWRRVDQSWERNRSSITTSGSAVKIAVT